MNNFQANFTILLWALMLDLLFNFFKNVLWNFVSVFPSSSLWSNLHTNLFFLSNGLILLVDAVSLYNMQHLGHLFIWLENCDGNVIELPFASLKHCVLKMKRFNLNL